MSEKLKKCHCTCPGHGMSCEVADDKDIGKKGYTELRRGIDRRIREKYRGVCMTVLEEQGDD